MENSTCGFLEITVGPMYSGKTTDLIKQWYQFTDCNKNVLVINYAEDKRYHSEMLSTHDKKTIPCTFCYKISDLLENGMVQWADVVLINEGQFFSDIYESVIEIVEKHNKYVYICGLDGDFRRNKFGRLLDLVPFCDKLTKLTANCVLCSLPALFSHRVTAEEGQVVIGSDNYIPLCRSCYKIKC